MKNAVVRFPPPEEKTLKNSLFTVTTLGLLCTFPQPYIPARSIYANGVAAIIVFAYKGKINLQDAFM